MALILFRSSIVRLFAISSTLVYKRENGLTAPTEGCPIVIDGDLKNTYAWFAFEETAFRLADELGLGYRFQFIS